MKKGNNSKYADIAPPQGGLGVGSLFLRSSFALPSLYLRSDTNEKVEAQWSYGEGIAKMLPT